MGVEIEIRSIRFGVETQRQREKGFRSMDCWAAGSSRAAHEPACAVDRTIRSVGLETCPFAPPPSGVRQTV